MRSTPASRAGKTYMAANGSKIENYGEKKVVGYTDDWTGISMTMQCADVRKTLASAHRMNQGGNKVVLDGTNSYIYHKAAGSTTPITYEDGQYVFYMWVPKDRKSAGIEGRKIISTNRYAALAVDDEDMSGNPGFLGGARARKPGSTGNGREGIFRKHWW